MYFLKNDLFLGFCSRYATVLFIAFHLEYLWYHSSFVNQLHSFISINKYCSLWVTCMGMKCLNLNCRSNCQKFAAKVSRGSICEQVRCLNCDCFEYQHDWVARWDPQLLFSHVYISSRNTPTSSRASAPHLTSTTTQPDNRKISGVNEELHSLYVPSTNRHSSSSSL